jgi:hypothetical protein
MVWKPKPKKWDWRPFLTVEEEIEIKTIEAARDELVAARSRLARRRHRIVNRAIHRAKEANT